MELFEINFYCIIIFNCTRLIVIHCQTLQFNEINDFLISQVLESILFRVVVRLIWCSISFPKNILIEIFFLLWAQKLKTLLIKLCCIKIYRLDILWKTLFKKVLSYILEWKIGDRDNFCKFENLGLKDDFASPPNLDRDKLIERTALRNQATIGNLFSRYVFVISKSLAQSIFWFVLKFIQ